MAKKICELKNTYKERFGNTDPLEKQPNKYR